MFFKDCIFFERGHLVILIDKPVYNMVDELYGL
jgi:hypothetical protein